MLDLIIIGGVVVAAAGYIAAVYAEHKRYLDEIAARMSEEL